VLQQAVSDARLLGTGENTSLRLAARRWIRPSDEAQPFSLGWISTS
jgi:hypothetical protein